MTKKMGKREGCHTYVAIENALIFRGKGRQLSIWDRKKETTTGWTFLRPSCWLSVVPANGMMLAPEGGAGCSCGKWLETSLGFSPKKKENK